MLGIPSKELKAAAEQAERTAAELELAAKHMQALLITANAILEDWRALSAEMRRKLLEGK